MKDDTTQHDHDESMHHGGRGGHGRHGRYGHHHGGAQTFRRGRAVDFLGRLKVKQATLKAQLEQPELRLYIQSLAVN